MKNDKNQATNTRNELLKAANALILEEGANKLTLEAVAKRASVSKGGLLYHFPSKEALVEGLIGYLYNQFDLDLEQELAKPENSTAGGWLRAYLAVCAQPNSAIMDSSAALLAAVANNPKLLEIKYEKLGTYQQKVEQSGVDPIIATIVRLAADGLWLCELFRIEPPTGLLRNQVLAKLTEMTQIKEETK